MSVWTDAIQASAAVINIGVVGFIAYRQGSSLRKQIKQRSSNIAGLLTFQLADIQMALGFSNKDDNEPSELSTFANMNLSRHLSDELVIEYLDIETTQEIFELWDELAVLQRKIREALLHNSSNAVAEEIKEELTIMAKFLRDLHMRLAKRSGYRVRKQDMTTI